MLHLFQCVADSTSFTNLCHEQNGLELGDETVKIFLNTKGTIGEVGAKSAHPAPAPTLGHPWPSVDDDIDKFLAYVDGKAAEGEFTQDIAAEVERLKQHNETKVEYMTLMMELKEQRREGYDEGKESERVISIRNLMKNMKLSAKQAMDVLEIPASEQEKYMALI